MGFVVIDADGQRFFCADQHHQFAAAGNGRVNQIALQKNIMLGQDGDHYGRIFGTLRLVDRDGISQNNFIEFEKSVKNLKEMVSKTLYEDLLKINAVSDSNVRSGAYLTLAGLVLGLILAVVISSNISKPMKQVVDVIGKWAAISILALLAGLALAYTPSLGKESEPAAAKPKKQKTSIH